MSFWNSFSGSLKLTAHKRYPFLLFELKSFTQQVIIRGRVFLRVFLNEIKGIKEPSNSVKDILSHTKVLQIRQKPLTNLSLENRQWNTLLSRLVGKRGNNVLATSTKNLTNGNTLSLVGVGYIHKGNVPVLFDERDELEAFSRDIRVRFTSHRWNLEQFQKKGPIALNLDDVQFRQCIAKGCNAAIYEAIINGHFTEPLAVKVMFNYDAESNVGSILRAMNKECLTFCGDFGQDIPSIFKNRVKLNYHPNIIEIISAFTATVPKLPDAEKIFPCALPRRLFEHGYGRNMTLFLAMKKYDITLKDYFASYSPKKKTSLILLSQLFDGISYLVKNGIAHRDLKSDNILLDLKEGVQYPWLVITDFGLCTTSLSLPFFSEEIERGGNRALMAPEIINAKPGPFTYLDYSASDLWAAGAIGYEIMGEMNPFYKYQERPNHLYSESYRETDLPNISKSKTIDGLLKAILSRSPSSRPTASQARTVCNLLLFSTKKNLVSLKSLARTHLKPSTKAEKLISWLREICATSFLQRTSLLNGRKLNSVEMKLRLMFLSQINPNDLYFALNYLRSD